jgi:uncharacterized protein
MESPANNVVRLSVLRLALLLPFAPLQSADAASFDCKRAATSAEHLICSDEKLSWLDNDLGRAYALAVHVAPDPEKIRDEQRVWLRRRDRCLQDSPRCNQTAIENLYRERITQLDSMAVRSRHAPYGQVWLPPEVAAFIQPGTTAVDLERGDVIGDGQKDYLFVLREGPEDLSPILRLLILVPEKSVLRLAAQSKGVSDCVGGMAGSFDAIPTGNGFKVVETIGAGMAVTTYTLTFKYLPRQEAWVLIEADRLNEDIQQSPPLHQRAVRKPYEHGQVLRFEDFDCDSYFDSFPP